VSTITRRRFLQGAGVLGLGLLARCARLPGQASPTRVARVGYLGDNTPFAKERAAAFGDGLRELGDDEGQNVVVEWRLTDGSPEQVAAAATELAALPVDVIVAATVVFVRPAIAATKTIPIVMAQSSDPVAAGFVASLARPGGNVTGLSGLTPQLSAKRLELLRDTLPSLSRVAILWNPAVPDRVVDFQQAQDAARAMGLELLSLEARESGGVAAALEAALGQHTEAVIVLPDPVTTRAAPYLAAFTAQHALPAMYVDKELMLEAGGLIAYGPNNVAMQRRAAYYVDRILKGDKPADLPVEQPMIFDFVINLKTAQALGLAIPQHVLLQATEVIQ
jgi:putative tryptophan/tyrosine transport system substrate-binding protein